MKHKKTTLFYSEK